MVEKVCIFVDGENFRHSICDVFEGEFDQSEYLPRNADWTEFFDYLVSKIVSHNTIQRLRAYWYVIQFVDYQPYDIPKPREDSAAFVKVVSRDADTKKEIQRTDTTDLPNRLDQIYKRLEARERGFHRRFQGWMRVQNAIAGRHDSVEFRRAGAITYNLHRQSLGQEKAVDVKLAVDLIILKDSYDIAVIVSGDQDYVPAVQAAKDYGKRVINVAFLTRSGNLLPGGARRLNHVTDSSIQVPYGDLKSLLKVSPAPTTP